MPVSVYFTWTFRYASVVAPEKAGEARTPPKECSNNTLNMLIRVILHTKHRQLCIPLRIHLETKIRMTAHVCSCVLGMGDIDILAYDYVKQTYHDYHDY